MELQEQATEKTLISTLKFGLIFLFMLMPWLWVSMGLYRIHDFKITFALYYLLGCTLPLLFFPKPSFSFNKLFFKKRWLFLMLVVGNAAMLSAWFLLSQQIFLWDGFVEKLVGFSYNPKTDFLAFAIFFVTINPIFEEIFWRSFVYEQLKTKLGFQPAILISSFFFGAWHWVILQYFFQPIWALLITFAVMIGGVIFALLYEKSQSLVPSILVHSLAADLPVIFMFYTALKQVNAF